MMLTIMIVIFGLLIMLKFYYKKAKPGEVIVLNSLKTNPSIIRTGTLVLPIIHRATVMDLTTQVIEIEQHSLDKISALFDVSLNTLSVQIENTEPGIIKAYERINKEGDGISSLKSILEHSIQEGLRSIKDYDKFKLHLSNSLRKVGYELVV